MKIKEFLKKYGLLIATIVYIVSPVDIVPEALVPFAGYGDDALVLIAQIIYMLIENKKSHDATKPADSNIVDGEIS